LKAPLRRLVLLAVLTSASAAFAHQQGVGYSDIEVGDGRVRYDLVLSTHDIGADADGDGLLSDDEVLRAYPNLRRLFARALLVEAGGTPCPLELQDFTIEPEERIVFRLRGACSDALPVRVAVRVLMLTGASGYNLAKIRVGGGFEEHVFDRDHPEAIVGTAPSLGATFRRFFVLGVEHIATGYDHVLFLIALLLVGGGLRALVAIVTAFTIAHSVTLSLAVLDVVHLPSRLVESAIALSIAWVALENIVFDRGRGRWRITFAFGLMHGFGFAAVLREMQLPREGLVASLLAFNLGVEAGQLAIVLLTYPFIALLQRSAHRTLVVRVLSGVILVLALWWFVERAFG
jgi:hydrogenase/urease accessory protein HupE